MEVGFAFASRRPFLSDLGLERAANLGRVLTYRLGTIGGEPRLD